MNSYLSARLPPEYVHSVSEACESTSQPRQKARQFCAHYNTNPSALQHFSVLELTESPELWFVSTAEGVARSKWLTEAYPKHIERVVEITDSVLKCPKCKQHTVDYYEKQTRGADEPMTLFANCLNCGNRWRQ